MQRGLVEGATAVAYGRHVALQLGAHQHHLEVRDGRRRRVEVLGAVHRLLEAPGCPAALARAVVAGGVHPAA
eukprot:4020748-Lingulodinium_polyedra.AAC.1